MPKYSPLAEVHAELDAKMIPFQGWSVPAGYPGGAVAEHRHTRKFCSVFDYSFCGKIHYFLYFRRRKQACNCKKDFCNGYQ